MSRIPSPNPMKNPTTARDQDQPVTFADVKAILDFLVKGKESDLTIIHGGTFGWATREQLADAVVDVGTGTTYRLIDPSLVGNGRGVETFLIQALTTGVDGNPKMPYLGNDEGLYASQEQLDTIIRWIDAGLPV